MSRVTHGNEWPLLFQKAADNLKKRQLMLHDQGITVLKYLHISRQEQRKRLQARLDDPLKQPKLQASVFSDRQLWPDYWAA